MKSPRAGVTLLELLVAVSLFSLLAVGVVFAFRIGLNAMESSNERIIGNRRVLGVDRVLTQQIAGFVPVKADCMGSPDTPPARVPFFQGEPLTMRFVSTFSLNEASRGYPRLLEYQVIPGEDAQGVRLVVNEFIYTGPLSAGRACAGVVSDPGLGVQRILFRPVEIGPFSFVLADKLASCQFAFKEEREPPRPDVWLPRWVSQRVPNAIRIDMAPLISHATRIEVPSVIAPVRITRDPGKQYQDIDPEPPRR